MLLGPMTATPLGSTCKLLSSYQLDSSKTSPRFSKEAAVPCPRDAAGCWPWFSTADLEKATVLKPDTDPSAWSGWRKERVCLGRQA